MPPECCEANPNPTDSYGLVCTWTDTLMAWIVNETLPLFSRVCTEGGRQLSPYFCNVTSLQISATFTANCMANAPLPSRATKVAITVVLSTMGAVALYAVVNQLIRNSKRRRQKAEVDPESTLTEQLMAPPPTTRAQADVERK